MAWCRAISIWPSGLRGLADPAQILEFTFIQGSLSFLAANCLTSSVSFANSGWVLYVSTAHSICSKTKLRTRPSILMPFFSPLSKSLLSTLWKLVSPMQSYALLVKIQKCKREKFFVQDESISLKELVIIKMCCPQLINHINSSSILINLKMAWI